MPVRRADPIVDDGLSLAALAVGVVLTMVMAGAAGLIHYFGTGSGERSVTGPWGSLAFTVVIAAPAVVAVIGSSGRPWVLGAAGVAQLPMVMLSFSPLFLPLWGSAAIFISQAASMRRGAWRSRWQPVAATVSGIALLAAMACLVVHQDPVSWTTATEYGSSSDVITATESALAFLCVLAAGVAATVAPRDRNASI